VIARGRPAELGNNGAKLECQVIAGASAPGYHPQLKIDPIFPQSQGHISQVNVPNSAPVFESFRNRRHRSNLRATIFVRVMDKMGYQRKFDLTSSFLIF
jgi:hypothetical protein